MITVLAGSNWFALKSALNKICEDFTLGHGDLGLEKIYAPDVSYDSIAGAVESVSLFATDKLVIVTDLSINKDASSRIERLADKVDDETHLVIVESTLDKRSAYYKSVKKLPGYKEFQELDRIALEAWIVKYINENGGSIGRADSRYLMDRVGENQTALEREISKLLSYSDVVTKKSIDLLTEQTPMGTIFNLVDEAFAGNLKNALKMYDEQRAQKVEPQAIYGMLVWQMHIVSICVSAGDKTAQTIANETGMNSYVINKAYSISKKMGTKKVQDFLALLRNIELTSKKQTYNLDDALKHAILVLAY